MKENLTHIRFILDRSGSMMGIRDSTIKGFNEFVEGQRGVPGECTMTLHLFDSQDPNEIVHDRINVKDMPSLTVEKFVPRGATPLHDAIGMAIDSLGRQLKAFPEAERPAKIIFAIMTDGLENSSRDYKAAQIADMIERQRSVYKWEFLFLGANQDACMTGENIGIARDHAITYAATARGTSAVMGMTANKVRDFRISGQSGSLAYNKEDREEAEKK